MTGGDDEHPASTPVSGIGEQSSVSIPEMEDFGKSSSTQGRESFVGANHSNIDLKANDDIRDLPKESRNMQSVVDPEAERIDSEQTQHSAASDAAAETYHATDATMQPSKVTSTTPSVGVREVVGSGFVGFSDLVNDNMIAARSAAVASIGLLAIYGFINTPLFFRYRTVSEIPSLYFKRRRRIHCRLLKATTLGSSDDGYSTNAPTPEQPIRLYLRHLAPVERLVFSKSWFDYFMGMHPSATMGKRPDESEQELLQVELAGIKAPPEYYSYTEQPGQWLDRLVRDKKPMVTCELIARRVRTRRDNTTTRRGAKFFKRKLSDDAVKVQNETQEASEQEDFYESLLDQNDQHQVAICKLSYRPQPLQLFSTDLAVAMVRFGQATPLSDGLYEYKQSEDDDEEFQYNLTDMTEDIKVLRNDTSYMRMLDKAEYDAVKNQHGMWSDAMVRESRPDIVDEVEFQANATIWQRLFRWLKER